MKLQLAGCLTAALLFSAPALTSLHAQVQTSEPHPPMSSQRLEFDVSSLNGLTVHGEARGVEGLDYTAAVSISVHDNHSVLHRLFLDRNHNIYFGYNLEAWQVEGETAVHLRFSPLTSLSSFTGVDVSAYRPREMALPSDQTIDINTPFEVPLELSDSGGRVLRDKLSFHREEHMN